MEHFRQGVRKLFGVCIEPAIICTRLRPSFPKPATARAEPRQADTSGSKPLRHRMPQGFDVPRHFLRVLVKVCSRFTFRLMTS